MWWVWTIVGLVATWGLLLLGLFIARPDHGSLRDGARILPDTLRLVGRLAADRATPLAARLPLWALVAYLALPIDLIPDFVPVIGWADDLIVASVVLRHLVRRAGPEAVRAHWPGTDEGLAVLEGLLRLPLHPR